MLGGQQPPDDENGDSTIISLNLKASNEKQAVHHCANTADGGHLLNCDTPFASAKGWSAEMGLVFPPIFVAPLVDQEVVAQWQTVALAIGPDVVAALSSLCCG